MTPFKRMLLLRRGGQVLRFHTEGAFNHQTVATHTFGTLLFLFEIAEPEQLTKDLVRAALYHDLGEQTVGDLPAPVAWRNPEMKTQMEVDEHRYLAYLGVVTQLTASESALLIAADTLDLCYTALDNLIDSRLDAVSMVIRLMSPRIAARAAATTKAKELYENWRETARLLYSQQGRVLQALAGINAWECAPAVELQGVPELTGDDSHRCAEPSQLADHADG